MKQAKINLPSGEHLFKEHPKAAMRTAVPSGWQLLGADPTALTEEEAGEIMERVSGWDSVIYYNYNASGMDYRDIVEAAFTEATASLDSLAESLGISKPYVILKNVEK